MFYEHMVHFASFSPKLFSKRFYQMLTVFYFPVEKKHNQNSLMNTRATTPPDEIYFRCANKHKAD